MEENKRFKDIDISSSSNKASEKKVSNPESVETVKTDDLTKNIVLFIGPRTVGKTVALIRLTHFLEKNRKTDIKPNTAYRIDAGYQNSVRNFLDDLHNLDYSPERTGKIDFLVLDVYKDSELHCQFLEAPGEAYFDVNNIHDESFPPYIEEIIETDTNKVFVFFFEESMLIDSDPMAYAKKMGNLVRKLERKKDDIIIVFNKSDKKKALYRNNKPNIKAFKELIYKNPKYNSFIGAINEVGVPVKFVVFSSGNFTNVPNSNKKRWVHSKDHFPDTLWRTIDKCFKSWSIW